VSTAAERVATGAKFMDEMYPSWTRRIDMESLDLSSCERCVMGQLFGDFHVWRRSTSAGEDQLLSMGFAAESEGGPDEDMDAEYRDLTAAWLTEIKARLAGQS
jgi:hypothetical protein